MQGLIRHNLMDELQYETLIDHSNLLKGIIHQGSQLIPAFDVFLFDVFLLIYKYKISYHALHTLLPSDLILIALCEHPQLEKIRLRTKGSSSETYLAMKLITDLLLEQLRGSKMLQQLKEGANLIDAFSITERDSLKTLYAKSELDLSDLLMTLEGINQWLKNSPVDASNIGASNIGASAPTDPIGEALSLAASYEDVKQDAEEKLEKALDTLNAEATDFKESLKESFETRFAPIIKSYTLTNNQGKSPFTSIESPLESGETTDEERLVSGKPNVSQTPSRLEISYNIQSTIKEIIDTLHLDDVIKTTTNVLDQFAHQMDTLGIMKSERNTLTFDEVLGLYKRAQNPQFVGFVNKVGKKKANLRAITRKKKKQKIIPKDRIIYSDQLDYLIDDELINVSLAIEAFENDFYTRYLNDALLTLELVGEDEKHKGPIILCYDGSGSMKGEKIEETKALILSVIELARFQKRPIVLIQFASASEPMFIKQINPQMFSTTDLLEILDTYICGGTDFKKPLQEALVHIRSAVYKKSDILFITDGQCQIDSKFKQTFMAHKKEMKFKLYTVIIHSHTYNDYGDIGEISDKILDIKADNLNHWNETIDSQIYQII